MNINDVGFAFVTFNGAQGGKNRPILVTGITQHSITFFSVTSQYENKSPQIQKRYCPIGEWKAIGLTKPSWVEILCTGYKHNLLTIQNSNKLKACYNGALFCVFG